MSLHSERLLEHFQNPRNVGQLPPPAVTIEVTNPACGDVLRLAARVADGRIAEVRYQVRGCTASIAAGSALTEFLDQRALADLRAATPQFLAQTVEDALDGLQPASKHAAILCADGVKKLLSSLS